MGSCSSPGVPIAGCERYTKGEPGVPGLSARGQPIGPAACGGSSAAWDVMTNDRPLFPGPLDARSDSAGRSGRPADPEDARFDDLLRAVFLVGEGRTGLPGEGRMGERADDAESRAVAAPDPSRVAGHFAGVGDGDLLDLAADHDSVRRLLVEIAEVEAEVPGIGDEARSRIVPVPASDARVADAVRARAIAAFAAGSRTSERASRSGRRAPIVERSPSSVLLPMGPVSSVAAPEIAVVADRRSRTGHWTRLAIAASILIVPGVGLLVGGRQADAAVLALASFDRVDAAGAVETSGVRRLTRGEVVVARPGERIALRLVGGGRIVLGEQSRMSLGCDAPCDGQCGGPVFDVEAGDVAVAASASTGVAEPIALRVRSAGRVDVFEGAARVARDAAGVASLLLRADARVRWSPESGVARELTGPATLELGGPEFGGPEFGGRASSGQAPAEPRAGAVLPPPSATAFHDLEFFDGAVRRADDSIRVGARRWRIRPDDGPAPRASGAAAVPSAVPSADGTRVDSPGAASIRFDLTAGATGRVSWAADAPIFASRRLELRCRVTGDVGSSVIVRLEGVEGAAAVVSVPAQALPSGKDRDQGERERVVFELPASFEGSSDALAELVLSFAARDGSATVWFEGASFSGAPGPVLGRSNAGTASEGSVADRARHSALDGK